MKDNPKHKKLVLLDSHAIIHRAYHALPDFANSRGEPTGAIYGLCTMLFKIITDLKPDYIVACYDLPKKTFRHEAYSDYKGGRAKTDDALVAQLISSRELFKAFSIPLYECEGFEADDLLGTIAEQIKLKNTKDNHIDIVIASGDMDTLQLVDDDTVQVYTLKKGINDTIMYNQKSVFERFNFEPQYLPDYKGLRGDPSDNIIGIKGIGEKTATTLISKYGSIEKMYENLDRDKDFLSKNGITERIFKLLKDGEDEAIFSKTLATIRRDAPITFKLPNKVWKDTVDKERASVFFRDFEFKSLQNRFLNLLGEEVKEIEIKEDDLNTEDKIKIKKAKIGLWVLDSENTDPSIEDVLDYKQNNDINKALLNIEQDIEKQNLSYVYNNIELPIIDIIDDMERYGIRVDKKYLDKLSKDYHKELSLIEKNIWDMCGREFNINSPKQLGEVLYDDLGLKISGMKKNASGNRSTKESELDKLREIHPVINEVLKYRELQKLLSTYIDTIPTLISDDGRLHAQFIQTGSTTGRFSSNNPNLQNIPIKTEKGKNIRNAFVAEEGYKFVSFDYSQIELRVAALLSQDDYFIQAFNEGKDIHEAVAMKVFKVKKEDVTSDMRRRAKVINFGILYGMGVNALRENLGSTRAEAQIFYDSYFAEFPTIASYLESIKTFAKDHGYTQTLFGRKRYFKGINSPLPFMQAMALRMATNAPIQGTATADIIKIGMKRAHDALEKEGILEDTHLILQVHDELIYEIRNDKVDQAINIIRNAMENAIPPSFLNGIKSVPLVVSCNVGEDWGKLK